MAPRRVSKRWASRRRLVAPEYATSGLEIRCPVQLSYGRGMWHVASCSSKSRNCRHLQDERECVANVFFSTAFLLILTVVADWLNGIIWRQLSRPLRVTTPFPTARLVATLVHYR
jgi:hypothetical protein